MHVHVIITDLAISLVLTTFYNKPKKFNFVHQTVSRQEMWHATRRLLLSVCLYCFHLGFVYKIGNIDCVHAEGLA